MKKTKSAKDLAFDKERVKYRKEIRDRDSLIDEQRYIISRLQESINERDNKISECEDWIHRLLEYMDMSEKDMRKIIQKDKTMAEAAERFSDIDRMVSRLFW